MEEIKKSQDKIKNPANRYVIEKQSQIHRERVRREGLKT